jgi:hypothetical protein
MKHAENTTDPHKELVRKVKTMELILLPIAIALFMTSFTEVVKEWYTRFTVIFLVSFASYLAMYMYKKDKGIETDDLKVRFVDILIRSSIYSFTLTVYVSIFLFGNAQPLIFFNATNFTLDIGLRTLGVNIGTWALVWILSYLLSRRLVGVL